MIKLIVDCDPGHDDALALLLASRAENITLLGVTTVAGNCALRYTQENARKILNYADVYDVPVYAGCDRPLAREPYRAGGENVHGKDGLGGCRLPDPVTPLGEEHAVDFLIRTLRESREPIVIAAIGPLTNIAQAFLKAPDIKEKIDRLVIMGGAVIEPGNMTSAAEFNFYVDPEAAKLVMASGCPIFLTALDVSMKALFRVEDIAALRAQGGKLSLLAADLLDHFAEAHIPYLGEKACPVHDALCIGVLIDEGLITYRETFIDIAVDDPLTAGESVADLWGILGKAPNCRLSAAVDRERFVALLTEYLRRPYRPKERKEGVSL